MMERCGEIDQEQLAAWVDGALAGETERRRVAAHVAACPRCAAAADRLRVYKERLVRYRAASTPAALPTGFWEKIEASLPAVRTPVRSGGRGRPPLGRVRASSAGGWRMAAALASLALLIAVATLAVALWPRTAPMPEVDRMLDAPVPPSLQMATAEPDRAAQWLGDQLRSTIAPVSLSLTGARLMGATADPRGKEGAFVYRDARGVWITLRLYLAPGATLPPMTSVAYEGSTYRVLERTSPRATLAAWQHGGRTYVAVAPLPLAQLLPHVREMDRHCRRNP